jgi:hypothetical protein
MDNGSAPGAIVAVLPGVISEGTPVPLSVERQWFQVTFKAQRLSIT